jgi:agmatine deiminase
MKQIVIALSFISLFSACGNKETQLSYETFYMPAEWEPHDAVWLGWEKDSTYRFYPSIGKIITTL